jgi:hypothetical protein
MYPENERKRLFFFAFCSVFTTFAAAKNRGTGVGQAMAEPPLTKQE